MANGSPITYYEISEKYKEEWKKGNKISYDQARQLIKQDQLAGNQPRPQATGLPQSPIYQGMSTEPGSAEQLINPSALPPERADARSGLLGDAIDRIDPQDEAWDDAIWDTIGGTLWGLGKTGTLGASDYLSRKVLGDQAVDDVLHDWGSSKLGRMGMMLGEAAGFLRGMGIVKGGLAKATNIIPGLKGTTRGLQRTAGTKLAKDINNNILKGISKKGVSNKEAQQLVKNMTDDVVGFGDKAGVGSRAKGTWDFLNPFAHSAKPYMNMRQGSAYVETAQNMMRATTPGKIKKFLQAKGIAAGDDAIRSLSDDVIAQVAKNPINNLDDLIVGRWGGKFSQIAGGIAQEAVDLGITGVMMDLHMYDNGELKPKFGQSYAGKFGEQLLHHGLTGAAFGGIRTGLGIPFLMGGSSLPVYQKVMKAIDRTPWADNALKKFGGNVRGFNKHIKGMKDPEEMRALLKTTMDTNRSFTIKLKNKNSLYHGSPLLERGTAFGKNELPTVKDALIKWNEKSLSTFRKGLPIDIIKDIAFSSPRWMAGIAVMNWSGLNSGVFDHMDPDEAGAHLLLSAWMSKRGKPLRSKGTSNPEFGWHTGERPYFYNEDLVKIHSTMKSLGYNTSHISDITRAYDNDIWNTHQSKVQNRDTQEIIRSLESNDIIYNKDEYIEKHGADLRPDGFGEPITKELQELISPLRGELQALGYSINPNKKVTRMENSLNEIHRIKSNVLSTPSNPVPLNSSLRIRQSMVKGSEPLWNQKGKELVDLYKQQIELLTGKKDWIDENGNVTNIVTFDPNLKPSSAKQQRAAAEFFNLQNQLESVGLIKVNEINFGKNYGLDVQKRYDTNKEAFAENIENLSMHFGREVYGPNSNEPVRIDSDELFLMIGRNIFNRNVKTNYDILHNNKEGLPQDVKPSTVDDIVSLTHQILAPNDRMSDKSAIIDNVLNLKMDTKSDDYIKMWGNDQGAEVHQLAEMVTNLYSIMKSGKSPTPGKSTYTVTQAKELQGKLVELGMPDPLRNRGEDFRDWTQKMTNHGFNEAIGGLDISNEHRYSINRLMEGGLAIVHKGNTQLGTRLEMVRELTVEDITRMNPELINDPTQVKEIQDLWTGLVESLPNKAINKTDRIENLFLSQQQLGTIRAAAAVNDLNTHKVNSRELHEPIIKVYTELQEQRQVLEPALKDPEQISQSDFDAITAKTKLIDQQEVLLKEWDIKYWTNVGGVGGDLTRSAAYYHHVKNTKIEGKSVAEWFVEMSKAREGLDYETFDTISERIVGLQQEIAKRWLNRPEVFTDIEIQREESFIHHQAEELQGKLNADEKNKITPDNFFTDYASAKRIPMMDAVSIEVAAAGGTRKTYDTATEALYDLYEKTSAIGNTEGFKTALYRSVGDKGLTPSNKLKNDVVKLHNLFERQFSVNKVRVNLSGDTKSLAYTGVFKKGQITHSAFTDLYTDIFPGSELNLLSDQVLYDGRLTSPRESWDNLINTVSQHRFMVTQESGSTKNQKLARPEIQVESGSDMFETFDMSKQGFKGKQYIVGLDENITFLVSHKNFSQLGAAFKKWHTDNRQSNYVLNSIAKHRGAQQLFERLDRYAEFLDKSLLEGKYDGNLFKKQSSSESNRLMNRAVHEMINVIYGEKVNKNWLESAYAENMAYKDFKYKRLASNQGYARNTQKRRDFVFDVWGNELGYVGDIVRKYSPMNKYNNLVIDDAGTVSKTGEISTGYVTDNRSIAERSVNKQFKDGEINETQRDYMMNKLFKSPSINAEHVNAATVARKSFLDYILTSEANSQLIGNSPGHKPVGVSSFTDSKGNLHVFYNKTHYFYDKKFDKFFSNNPDIQQITFTSGAKKAEIINPNDPTLRNKLVPRKSPTVNDNITLPEWLNNEANFKNLKYNEGTNGVVTVDANQNLIGATYGAAKGAKVLKQLSNWSNHQADLYRYSRADAVKNFGAVTYNLYDPARPSEASSFAMQYLSQKNNKGNAHNPENENISTAALWISGGGVPYSRIAKNLYDNMVKTRFIDDAGVFDGFTPAGGTPILRPDFSGELRTPVYQEINNREIQSVLGEANVGFDFLDRTIPFTGKFGQTKVEKKVKGTVRRRNAEELSTVNIAVSVPHKTNGNRDIMIDVKNRLVEDPFGDITDFKKLPKEKRGLAEHLIRQINKGHITRFRELVSELGFSHIVNKYGKSNLVGLFSPAPRTGPHDLIAAKIKNIIPKKDGGVAELNSYDLTLRAQRDHDTDKLPFYLDMPFSSASEAYRSNSLISEAQPAALGIKSKPEFDPYSYDDFFEHKHRVNEAGFLRGKVQKEHRKLDYARLIFDKIKDISIDIGGESYKLEFKHDSQNMQRLTNDSQRILDPYDGIPKNVFDPAWTHNTRFGRSDYFGDQSDKATIGDSPFFRMRVGGEKSVITEPVLKEITNKILEDYGRLLTIESGIWEAGEMKTPRYQDMLTLWRNFKGEYHPKRINWNFYNTLKEAGVQGLDQIFFPKGDKSKSINDVLGKLSVAVNESPTTFLKSLEGITKHDMLKVREIVNPGGDYFNQGVMQMLGRYRGEVLENIKNGEGIPGNVDGTPLIDNLWNGFKRNNKTEEMMVQLNNLEAQLSSVESVLNRKFEEKLGDNPDVIRMAADVSIKRNALIAMSDKLMLENSNTLPDIEIKKGGLTADKQPYTFNGAGVVRDAKTGKVISEWGPGSENIFVGKDQVFIKGGVRLVPVVEHEMFDAIALARSTLGYYAHIETSDLTRFKQIVGNTQKKINKSMIATMEYNKYRDWSRHYAKVQEAIDSGLKQIEMLANTESLSENRVETNVGNYPQGKETYGIDFIMSLLVPKEHYGNDRAHYYNPKTREFLPAIQNINKSVVDAATSALKNYNLAPDYPAFIKDLAKTHKPNYEALVAGDGFDMAVRDLHNSTFEGALLGNVIDNVLHDPFMSRKEYKSFGENAELNATVGSNFAELYRQILQEGTMTDPITVFKLKERLIKSYGPDAYNSIFKQSRGDIVFDGVSSRQFSSGKGEGQLIGQLLYPKGPNEIYKAPKVIRKAKDSAEIRRIGDQIVGENNLRKKRSCE